jgi:general secretion pathway protein D
MMRWMRLLPVFVFIVGCDGSQFNSESIDHMDRKLNLSRNDYRDFYDGKTDKNTAKGSRSLQLSPPVPDIAPLLAAPRPPKIGNSQIVSIAVTDDVPLKDVLVELARLADVDIEIDSGIVGGINFRAKEKPFNQVIERIASLAGLRYSIRNGVLRVERDMPYVINYRVDFLNLTRNSSNSIATGGGAAGGAAGGAGGGAGGAAGGGAAGGAAGGGAGGAGAGGGGVGASGVSTTSISGNVSDDFWAALQSGITSILFSQQSVMTSEALNQENNENAMAGGLAGGLAGGAGGGMAGGAAGLGGDMGAGGGMGGGAMSATARPGYFMTINRQAGIITVSANQWQHDTIKKYIDQVRMNASSQVIIEAKILEVTLNDEYESGIDWKNINLGRLNIGADFQLQDTDRGDFVSLALPSGDINALATLVEQFGTTRTLSSPRLNAINNQPAVLTVTRNEVVFDISVEQATTAAAAAGVGGALPAIQQPTITVQRQFVPIGIVLNLLPTIDLETNEVTMNIRPTITRQVGTAQDPAPNLALAALTSSNPGASADIPQNFIPIIEVRELDSIIKSKSGGVMVIGGLMEQSSENTDRGAPWLSDIPIIGNLTKSVRKRDVNKELVVLIRATIVTPQGNHHPADRQLYKKFTDDPRPLAF